MVPGMTNRAVAIVRTMASKGIGSFSSAASLSPMGVPLIGTRALTGKDSGCDSMVDTV